MRLLPNNNRAQQFARFCNSILRLQSILNLNMCCSRRYSSIHTIKLNRQKRVTPDLDIFFSLKFKTVLIEIMKNHEIKKMEGESLYTLL